MSFGSGFSQGGFGQSGPQSFPGVGSASGANFTRPGSRGGGGGSGFGFGAGGNFDIQGLLERLRGLTGRFGQDQGGFPGQGQRFQSGPGFSRPNAGPIRTALGAGPGFGSGPGVSQPNVGPISAAPQPGGGFSPFLSQPSILIQKGDEQRVFDAQRNRTGAFAPDGAIGGGLQQPFRRRAF